MVEISRVTLVNESKLMLVVRGINIGYSATFALSKTPDVLK
jgi:hypothetical protein